MMAWYLFRLSVRCGIAAFLAMLGTMRLLPQSVVQRVYDALLTETIFVGLDISRQRVSWKYRLANRSAPPTV